MHAYIANFKSLVQRAVQMVNLNFQKHEIIKLYI